MGQHRIIFFIEIQKTGNDSAPMCLCLGKMWKSNVKNIIPKSIGTLTVLKCIFVPNLEILTTIGGDLRPGQTDNGASFHFEVQFDLEDQGQSPQKQEGF